MEFRIVNGIGVIGGKPVEHGETWERPPGQGIRIFCANGYTVSVAWGPHHYGNGETCAEVGIKDRNGNLMYSEEWEDEVWGWATPFEIWELYKEVCTWD